MNLNKVMLIGRLTANPELTYAQSGTAITKFNVATNNRYKNAGGEWVEDVDFHPVVCFGKKAESSAEFLQKGQEVFIEGRLSHNKYEKDVGGETMTLYYTSVVANIVEFGSRAKGTADPVPPPAEYGAVAPTQPQARPVQPQAQPQYAAPVQQQVPPPQQQYATQPQGQPQPVPNHGDTMAAANVGRAPAPAPAINYEDDDLPF